MVVVVVVIVVMVESPLNKAWGVTQRGAWDVKGSKAEGEKRLGSR